MAVGVDIWDLVLSSNGDLLAFNADGNLCVWNIWKKQWVRFRAEEEFERRHPSWPLTFSADSAELICLGSSRDEEGKRQGWVGRLDLKTGGISRKPRTRYERPQGTLWQEILSPDQSRLIWLTPPTGDNVEGTDVIVWSLKDQKRVFEAETRLIGPVSCGRYSPDGYIFATGRGRRRQYLGNKPVTYYSSPAEIQLFDTTNWKQVGQLRVADEGSIYASSFSADGTRLAAAVECGQPVRRGRGTTKDFIDIYEIPSLKRIVTIPYDAGEPDHYNRFKHVEFLGAEGQRLASTFGGAELQIWELPLVMRHHADMIDEPAIPRKEQGGE